MKTYFFIKRYTLVLSMLVKKSSFFEKYNFSQRQLAWNTIQLNLRKKRRTLEKLMKKRFVSLTQHLPTGLIRPLITNFFKMYNSHTYNNSRTIFFLSACQSERAFSEFVLRYKVFNIQVYARLI